jgi:hypothetical protein
MANAIALQMEERLESGDRDQNAVFEAFGWFNPGTANSVRFADTPVRAKQQRRQAQKQPANQAQELPLRTTERV